MIPCAFVFNRTVVRLSITDSVIVGPVQFSPNNAHTLITIANYYSTAMACHRMLLIVWLTQSETFTFQHQHVGT
jgi:hypothetical protein